MVKVDQIYRGLALRCDAWAITIENCDRCADRQQRQRRSIFANRSRGHGTRHLHEHDHGNQSSRTRYRSARNDRVSAKGNVEGRAAPDRWIALRNPYSAAKGSSAARSARANCAQLSSAQKPASGNQSSDKIFLGRVDAGTVFAVREASLRVLPIEFAKVPAMTEAWQSGKQSKPIFQICCR